MRAVVQRVQSASVEVGGVEIAQIGPGLLALVAIHREDTRRDLEWMARKIVELRVFEDAAGKMNLGLLDAAGELLVVSQFTLYGDCRKGRRPSYIDAAPPGRGRAPLLGVRPNRARARSGGARREVSGQDGGRARQLGTGDPDPRQPQPVNPPGAHLRI